MFRVFIHLLPSLLAAGQFCIVVAVFPRELAALEKYVLYWIGPTAPVLALLSAYAFAAVLATLFSSGRMAQVALLQHAVRIGGLAFTVGMIGTYLALLQGLSAGGPTPQSIANALTSTLAGLVVAALVLLGRELLAPGQATD